MMENGIGKLQGVVGEYLARWRAYTEAAWREQQANPPEFVRDLRERIQRKREMLVAGRGPGYLITGEP